MTNDPTIATIRAFNRFYTQTIGVLDERQLGTDYSLTEMRILHQLANTPGITATDLAERLNMDHGFLSRKLTGLINKKRVARDRSPRDKRQLHLSLTPMALKEHPAHEQAASDRVAQMLAPIPPERHTTLVNAMQTVQHIISNDGSAPIIFRQLALGDAGWVIHRHGAVMAKEFGWNHEFEALCAQIMADFIRNYKPDCERSWIAERAGEILGSIFLIRENETTARLRLLYVEPSARGLGLATKLLEKSIQFARSKDYAKVTLFTTSSNLGARRIYEKLGLTLVNEKPYSFAGQSLNGEDWDLAL